MVVAEPRFLTVEEVAGMLRVSPRTIYRLIERGELRAVRVGDLYRIPEAALQAFIGDEKD